MGWGVWEIREKKGPPKYFNILQKKPAQARIQKRPATFDIDYAICMNCGICEEVCPFDAIFMDHEFELAQYGRFEDLNYHKEKLLKSNDYFKKIRPTDAARIDQKRAAKAPKA